MLQKAREVLQSMEPPSRFFKRLPSRLANRYHQHFKVVSTNTYTFRPLQKISHYPDTIADITIENIESWQTSNSFAKAHAFFNEYPEISLVSATSRAFLHHVVRSIKPKHIVEIGTYHVGTSEILARALWENGSGLLHTTDPFGAERCPAIISRWPKELQKYVKYYPLNSMDFFLEMERERVSIDLAFIDGNHDFPFAHFDLICAAKLMRPGGIIVMDNVEQPGPYWATMEFLRQNPEWKELGNGIASFDPTDPFHMPRWSIDDTRLIALKAPPDVIVKSAPLTTGQTNYAGNRSTEGRLSGFKLEMTHPAPKGILHTQTFLRGFAPRHEPEQLISDSKTRLNGETCTTVMLSEPLQTPISQLNISCHHTVEIVLFWQPEGHNEPLRLKSLPIPFA